MTNDPEKHQPKNGATDGQVTGNNALHSLSDEWSQFIGIVLGPLVVFFGILTVAFVLLAAYASSILGAAPGIQAILSVIISLLAGLVGALLSDRWTKARQTGILVTRGQSAVRGLGLILRNINQLEKRSLYYSGLVAETQGSIDPLTALTYWEIKTQCIALQEQIINAVEEWRDILPELEDLNARLGIITELSERADKLSDEIVQLSRERDSANNKSTKNESEKMDLERKLKDKERELAAIRSELSAQKSRLGSFSVSDMGSVLPAGITGVNLTYDSLGSKCPHCGATIPYESGKIELQKTCPKCHKVVNPLSITGRWSADG